MTTSMSASPTMSLLRPWSDLPADLLGLTIARLPFPADRARYRAVCRGWCSAARTHLYQLPWLVLADGSFCTIGDDINDDYDDGGVFFPRGTIPGVPEDATCIGSTDGWLALDRTSDAYRRSNKRISDAYYKDYPRHDVRHNHSYLLHNPFSNETVPLPELDDIIGHASETFMVWKVLMRSSSPRDVIAVVTNSLNCNVILCRPGKGTFILPEFRICAIEFIGDWLYGITPDQDLLAFHIDEDGGGKPIVNVGKRIIKHQFSDDEIDYWSWMDHDDDNDNDNGDNNGVGDVGDDYEGEAPIQKVEDIFHELVMVSDDEETEMVPYTTEPPYNGDVVTIRNLVKSQRGELLMVKRTIQYPPFTYPYTRKLEIFKADMDVGTWTPVTHDALEQDEALFLSRGFCKSSRVVGHMEEGIIYFDYTEEVFDTESWSLLPYRIPLQRNQLNRTRLTWLFPPQLVV